MRQLIVFTGLISICFAAQAADWKLYVNDRFGFSVHVPASFKSSAPPENNDGLNFVSKDQTAEIRAYGYYIQSKNLTEDAREQEKLNSGLNITYRQVTSNAFTLSGLAGSRIVYIHAVKTCKGDAAAILRAEYPQSDKVQFDPLIAHMSKTFRGSNDCI
jgi:hypothetical protein